MADSYAEVPGSWDDHSGSVEPIQPETLRMLDRWRSAFVGNAFEIEWFHPEVSVLNEKKFLVAPSGAYWVVSNQPVPKVPGSRGRAIENVVEAIEEGGFSFGGEQLARAMFQQCHYDAIH